MGRRLVAFPPVFFFETGPDLLDLVLRQMLDADEVGARLLYGPQQLVQFRLHRGGIPVLGILYEKNHQEGDDRCAGVDDELPDLRKIKQGSADAPDEDGGERYDKALGEPEMRYGSQSE